MKKNSKGFTLVETLIVSAFVIGTLTYLFIQINNAKTNFDISFKYDDVNDVYNTKIVCNFLVNTGYSNLITNLQNGYTRVTSSNIYGDSNYYHKILEKIGTEYNTGKEKVWLLKESEISNIQSQIKNSTLNDSNLSEELKRYISRYDADTNSNKYVVVIEFNNGHIASARIG